MRFVLLPLLILAAGAVLPSADEDEAMEEINSRLSKYAPVEVSSEITDLTERQKAVLKKLIGAARLMDLAFWSQASNDGLAIRSELQGSESELDKARLHFLEINKCRFDRQANDEPFIGDTPKPAGATFWPEDLTRDELDEYVAAHPEQREELYKLTTLVRRSGERLEAVPYHVAYGVFLRPAAHLLCEAAELSENESFGRYLRLRAEALVTDDYLDSDMAWMELEGNMLDIVIGAIEPYEDGLMNLKGAYEAFVLVKDEEAGRELESYIENMDAMQKSLPVDPKFKQRSVQLDSSVGVFTLVYGAGDGDAGIKTIAISLPNDERVREAKGTRKIMLRNAIQAKYEKVLVPIAERLLAPEQHSLLDGDIFFSNILLHEIAHSLGNDFVLDAEGNKTELRIDEALKNYSSAIEECKADIAGLWGSELLIKKGIIPEENRSAVYTNFLAGIFRSVRFGAASTHGVSNAIQLNWLMEKGGISAGSDGLWRVHEDKFLNGVRDLCEELLTIQHSGDYERAGKLIDKYGKLPETLRKQLASMTDIPVDIEFVWK